jgi:arylsulfatase A-like enzyme
MHSSLLPHIVLIVMDSASAKRFSLYGHRRDTSPGLRRIAEAGVLYRYCFTPAIWTIPSHVSLFTGLYPHDHGCNLIHHVLPDYYYTLPEILQEVGYRTVVISSNMLISPAFQFNRGFSEYYGMDNLINSSRYYQALAAFKAFKKTTSSELKRFLFIIKDSIKNSHFFPLQDLINKVHKKYLRDVIKSSSYATERTGRYFRQIFSHRPDDRPIFLFINFMETHYDFNPPRRYNNIIKIGRRQKKKIARLNWKDFYLRNGFSPEEVELSRLLYDQEVAYLDDRIFQLYTFLEQQGLLDNTLFIVTADHGEFLGEHGLWGHEFGVYNELINIPLVIKYPASFNQKGISTNLAQLNDLFATIAEITDFPYPVPEKSYSLLGPPRDFALTDASVLPYEPRKFKEMAPQFEPWPQMQPCWAFIDSHLRKLILWADGRRELYDLKEDYEEQHNLADHPASQVQAEDMRQRLASLMTT